MKRIIEVRETYTNETLGYKFGETDWYEPYTDNIGKLFRDAQKEYGRCTSKIYADPPGQSTQPVGWYFEKVMQYDDARTKNDTYTRGVWFEYRVRYEADDESEAYEAMDLFAAAS
jgi:hypothetical protein